MSNAYHYQHTFNDEQAEEFRKILSMPFDPLHLDGMKLWLDASDLSRLTVDGSNKVSQWDDKSGLSHHAVQGTSTDQPISGQETLDGKNGVFFDYLSKHIMTSGYLPQAGDSLTSFILARRVDDSTPYGGGSVYKSLLSSGRPDTSGAEVGKYNVSENRDTGRLQTVSHKTNAYNSPDGTMLDGRAHIISSHLDLIADPNHVEGRADGVVEEFDDMYDPPVADDILLFEIGGSTSAGSRRFWGTIFEILIYDQPLSDEDILKVELYLAEKWHCYHPQAAWILEYDAVTQAAIHAGKLSRDDITTTASPLLLWLDAGDTSTITKDGSDLVSQWDDKSPHGNHVVQGTASLQPTYRSSGLGQSLPSVEFYADNTTKILSAPDVPSMDYSNTTVIAVIQRQTNLAGIEVMFGKYETSGDQREFNGNISSDTFRVSSTTDGTLGTLTTTSTMNAIALGVPTIVDMKYDGSSLRIRSQDDIANEGAVATTIFNGTSVFKLGAVTNTVQPYAGHIAELIVFNKVISDTDRAAILTYLSTKWGITL